MEMTSEIRQRPSHQQRTNTFEIGAIESGQGSSEDGTATSSNSQPRQRVKVKITLWRLANTCLLLGLAMAKAILAYQNNPSANAFDVALGLAWAFM
jgi:hypothetical protein